MYFGKLLLSKWFSFSCVARNVVYTHRYYPFSLSNLSYRKMLHVLNVHTLKQLQSLFWFEFSDSWSASRNQNVSTIHWSIHFHSRLSSGGRRWGGGCSHRRTRNTSCSTTDSDTYSGFKPEGTKPSWRCSRVTKKLLPKICWNCAECTETTLSLISSFQQHRSAPF